MKALNAVVGVVVVALMLSGVMCIQAVNAQSLLDELKGEDSDATIASSSSTDSTTQAPTRIGSGADMAAPTHYQPVVNYSPNYVAPVPASPVAMAVLAPAPATQMVAINIPATPGLAPIAQKANTTRLNGTAPRVSLTDPLLAGKAFTVTENYDYVYDYSPTGGTTGKGGWEQKLALMDVVVNADLAHDANGNVTKKYEAVYGDKAVTKLYKSIIADIGYDSAGREIKETVSMYMDAAGTNPVGVRITDTQRDANGAVVSKSISEYGYADNGKPMFAGATVLKDIVTDANGRELSLTDYSYADEARTQLMEVQKIKNTYTGSSNDPTDVEVLTYDSADMSDSHILVFEKITNFYEGTSQKIVSSYDSSGKLVFKDTYNGDELISHEVPSAEMEAPEAPTERTGAETVNNSDLDGTLAVQSTITAQAEQVKDVGATIAPQLATDKDALKDAVQK